MRKFVCGMMAIIVLPLFAAGSGMMPLDDHVSSDFLPLADPYKIIGGAYYGIGVGMSMISYNAKFQKHNSPTVMDFKKSCGQFDVSLICGFGSSFYQRYYAGIEMELFKRFSQKMCCGENRDIGVIFPSGIGLNMDTRFGYLFPQEGALVYLTLGFCRLLGKVTIFDDTSTRALKRGGRVISLGEKRSEGSFGSFYPTFGCGAEYKFNSNWNVRVDFRYAITSKENKKRILANNTGVEFEAKPQRMSIRVSAVRNI